MNRYYASATVRRYGGIVFMSVHVCVYPCVLRL